MTHPLAASALVGIGGFASSISRYGLSILFRSGSFEWPFGTLSANIFGGLITIEKVRIIKYIHGIASEITYRY